MEETMVFFIKHPAYHDFQNIPMDNSHLPYRVLFAFPKLFELLDLLNTEKSLLRYILLGERSVSNALYRQYMYEIDQNVKKAIMAK